MSLHGRIIPRADLAPNEFKALGAALKRWFGELLANLASGGNEVDGWIDRAAVNDLLAGELPQPFLLRVLPYQLGMRTVEMRASIERARATSPLIQKALPPLMARCVSFGITVTEDRLEREDILTGINNTIPLMWVSEIVIDG